MPLEESTLYHSIKKQGFLFRNSKLFGNKKQKFFQLRGNSFEIGNNNNKSKLIHFKDITAIHFVQSQCKKIKNHLYYPFYFYYYNSSQVKCKYILYSSSEQSRIDWVTAFVDARAQWLQFAKQIHPKEEEEKEVIPEPRINKHLKRRPSHLLGSTELQRSAAEELENKFQFAYA